MLKKALAWLPTCLIVLNAVAAIAVIAVAAKAIAIPMAAKHVYGEQYKGLVFECDDVMRGHFIAKARVQHQPSPQAIDELRSAELSLLACHDYDKLRKKLLTLGVTEHELAALGLEAIEEKARDVRKFVESHEIRF
jgi:hypothetical protein